MSRVDIERAGIGWRIAKAGDETDVADFAYQHMDEILTEIVQLQRDLALANEGLAQAQREIGRLSA